jgi:hypothetical protein
MPRLDICDRPRCGWEDSLLERAKEQAHHPGETVTALIEEGLQTVLARPREKTHKLKATSNRLGDGNPLEDPSARKRSAAVALGRLGRAKGGSARAATSSEQGKGIAKVASKPRWAGTPKLNG